VDDPLIFVRAVHFAATLSVTGVALFNVFVAQTVLRRPASPELRASVVRRLAWIAWIGLAVALLSGAAWFVLVSASISDQPFETVLSDASVLQAVLLDTDFGRDWLLRLPLIALLAGLLAADLREKQDSGGFLKLAVVLAAAGLTGTLAWGGHGIGGAGLGGRIHLAADFVHLIAAAAWVGGLLPLALVLAAVGGSLTVGCGEFALFRLWDRHRRCAVAHRRDQYLVPGEQHPGIDRDRLRSSPGGQNRLVPRHASARDGQSALAYAGTRCPRWPRAVARCVPATAPQRRHRDQCWRHHSLRCRSSWRDTARPGRIVTQRVFDVSRCKEHSERRGIRRPRCVVLVVGESGRVGLLPAFQQISSLGARKPSGLR
jgi:hypothetical protein